MPRDPNVISHGNRKQDIRSRENVLLFDGLVFSLVFAAMPTFMISCERGRYLSSVPQLPRNTGSMPHAQLPHPASLFMGTYLFIKELIVLLKLDSFVCLGNHVVPAFDIAPLLPQHIYLYVSVDVLYIPMA
jgi:hypothetical protein